MNTVIARRGLDKRELDRFADGVAYVMLLLLAMLDTSGGLLLIPILLLVARVIQYQYYLLLSFMPFVFVFLSDEWYSHDLFNAFLENIPSASRLSSDDHPGPSPPSSG